MPAVKYDYNYARSNKSNQGLAARGAKSINAYNQMSAQKRVSSNNYATNRVTKNVATTQNVKKVRRQNYADIDVPIVVKKKVELQKPEEMKLSKPKAKSQQKTERAKKSIVATVLAFGMLFVICTRYAQINELTHKIGTLEKELASVESLNQQLSAEVDSKTDLNYIEKYAKYQLGMQKPDEKQIVRIPYDKQDKISTPIVIEEEKEPSFIEKLWKDITNLID